jgi:hypothetical protein
VDTRDRFVNSPKKAEGLVFQFRTLSQEEYEREFPDEELEQESPSTDVDPDNDPDEDDDGNDGKETTADALRKAFERVAKGQTLTPKVSVSERPVTDRKPTAPEAPETSSYTSESAATVLAAALQRAREKKDQELRS